jgi:UDP-N-acetylmuramoyl-tripeptide--D-alanyl-D-alanine ligase
MKLRLKELYKLFNTGLKWPDAVISGITADSRLVKKGNVFVALIADSDGHKYAANALKAGAVAAIVEKDIPGVDKEKLIMVKDTKDALLKMAGYYFKKFRKLRVVAVTGSNGKTTTKELLGAVLSAKYKVHKSEKSFNNYLGLPLTVFGLKDGHEMLVLEIGMNHPGEIKKLVSAVKLDAAVITNVGRAHIGNFKGKEAGIAKAKAEIILGVKKGGVVILNREDKYYGFLRKKASAMKLKVLSFGTGTGASTRIEDYKAAENGSEFRVSGFKEKMKMGLKGLHNVYNASAAITAAKCFGISGLKIKTALSKFKMEGFMRFEEIKYGNGVTVINDCYNANPDSFAASIGTLKKAGYKDLVVLMGEMLEMGKLSPKLHAETGSMFRGLNIKKFFIYGGNAENVKRGYGLDAQVYTEREKLKADIMAYVKPGDTVFVKGSRGNKLEEVIDGLKG